MANEEHLKILQQKVKVIKSFKFCILILICSLWFSQSLSAKALFFADNPTLKRKGKIPSPSFPYKLVFNSVRGEKTTAYRKMFVLLKPDYFNETDLESLFLFLSTKYTHPQDLYITTFSDEKMLQRAINRYKDGLIITFKDSPKGKAAAEKWEQDNEPAKSGYFRSFYTRLEKEEFQYSLTKEDEEYRLINLKKKR